MEGKAFPPVPEARVRENRPGKGGGKGSQGCSWKRGGREEVKQLPGCAFELSFGVPNCLSTGVGQVCG